MNLRVSLAREELNDLQYPIIVENYERILGSMSKRNKYKEEFTEKERNKILRYKIIFHDWYLRKGTPESYTFSPETLTIIRKAIHFFATS